MDQAVALVKAYLEVNGYFVVAEYPVLAHDESWYIATDLDILAVRFPRATLNQEHARGLLVADLDPQLGVPAGMDMIVGEVKEGRVALNPAIRAPRVLATALQRFGCCDFDEVDEIVRQLARTGRVLTRSGHQIRFVSFGSYGEVTSAEREVSLDAATRFLRSHLTRHWSAFRHAQIKGSSALAFLQLLEKAERGAHGSRWRGNDD